MPCDSGYSRDYYQERLEVCRKSKLKLTAMLCKLLKAIDASNNNDIIPDDVLAWQKKHLAGDKMRRKLEGRVKKKRISELKDELNRLRQEFEDLTATKSTDPCAYCGHARSEHQCANYKCKHKPKDSCHHAKCKCVKFNED